MCTLLQVVHRVTLVCACALAQPARATTVAEQPDLAQRISKLEKTLRTDPSFRVRLQAAAVLGKLGGREAVLVLREALLHDKIPLVRATCAQALGNIQDPEARAVLEAARSDPSPEVRTHVEAAIARLGALGARPPDDPLPERRIAVVLGKTGCKGRSCLPDLPDQLREAIARGLRDHPQVMLVEGADPPRAGFSVESNIVEISQRVNASGVLEVTCEVSMTIGLLPTRTVVGMTSGGATIQLPRRVQRVDTQARRALVADALNHAVHGASENLIDFLRKQK